MAAWCFGVCFGDEDYKQVVMQKGLINKFWSFEDLEILKFLYPENSNISIAIFLNKTEASIIGKAFKMKLRKSDKFIKNCSEKGYFKKGTIPFNKGKKQSDYINESSLKRIKQTQFKKGRNHISFGKSLGNITFYSGQLWINTGYKKREIYSNYQYKKFIGEIPESHIVTFKDGNPKNCHPFNLTLLSRSENMQRNSIQRFPSELISTIKVLSKLKKIIKQQL